MNRATPTAVRDRAGQRCEYCGLDQADSPLASLHIEHIIPQSKGGRSLLENLALACPGCNLHKAGRATAVDPETGVQAKLFNPNLQLWAEHFRFEDYQIKGLTAEGRATVEALRMNHSRRQRIREAEEAFGLYPPV